MVRNRLRIYRGPEDEVAAEPSDPKQVTLPLEEVLPLLADAYESRRTWLSDFGSEEVTVSSDLYEVLLAYRFFSRPSA